MPDESQSVDTTEVDIEAIGDTLLLSFHGKTDNHWDMWLDRSAALDLALAILEALVVLGDALDVEDLHD